MCVHASKAHVFHRFHACTCVFVNDHIYLWVFVWLVLQYIASNMCMNVCMHGSVCTGSLCFHVVYVPA